MNRSRIFDRLGPGGGRLLAAGLALATAIAPAVAAPDTPGRTEADQGQAQMPATNATISDATIGKAGAALRDVAKVQEDYTGKLGAAGSNEEKRGLTEQANAEAVEAIQSHGLSLQEYSRVVQTAQSDPQLKQRLITAAQAAK
jgi:hypothetical protein